MEKKILRCLSGEFFRISALPLHAFLRSVGILPPVVPPKKRKDFLPRTNSCIRLISTGLKKKHPVAASDGAVWNNPG